MHKPSAAVHSIRPHPLHEETTAHAEQDASPQLRSHLGMTSQHGGTSGYGDMGSGMVTWQRRRRRRRRQELVHWAWPAPRAHERHLACSAVESSAWPALVRPRAPPAAAIASASAAAATAVAAARMPTARTVPACYTRGVEAHGVGGRAAAVRAAASSPLARHIHPAH